jgi:hypothetical protein
MASAFIGARTGKNGRHRLVRLMRQSILRQLAGYEEVNDADQLCPGRSPTGMAFQMAKVVVPRQMFVEILSTITRLRAPPASA